VIGLPYQLYRWHRHWCLSTHLIFSVWGSMEPDRTGYIFCEFVSIGGTYMEAGNRAKVSCVYDR